MDGTGGVTGQYLRLDDRDKCMRATQRLGNTFAGKCHRTVLPNSTLEGGKHRAVIQVPAHEARARVTPAAVASGAMSQPAKVVSTPTRSPALHRSYQGMLNFTAGSAFGAKPEIGPRTTPR